MNDRPSVSTQHAVSADGTSIAYEVTGSGPTLVMVEGAPVPSPDGRLR